LPAGGARSTAARPRASPWALPLRVLEALQGPGVLPPRQQGAQHSSQTARAHAERGAVEHGDQARHKAERAVADGVAQDGRDVGAHQPRPPAAHRPVTCREHELTWAAQCQGHHSAIQTDTGTQDERLAKTAGFVGPRADLRRRPWPRRGRAGPPRRRSGRSRCP